MSSYVNNFSLTRECQIMEEYDTVEVQVGLRPHVLILHSVNENT